MVHTNIVISLQKVATYRICSLFELLNSIVIRTVLGHSFYLKKISYRIVN